MKIIDVSEFQGYIDWSKVKNDCAGAIIRVGYRGYSVGSLKMDARFKENIKNATKAGVPVGVYFVTQAINKKEAKEEARYTVSLIEDYDLKLPIFVDCENGAVDASGRADGGKLSVKKRTRILKAFCKKVRNLGYESGIYTSESWYNYALDLSKLRQFFIWCAKYSTQKPNIQYDAWQYTSKARISGVGTNCDVSDFKYYSKPQKSAEEAESGVKSIDDLAKEVIAGKWGSGDDRIEKLTAAGYDYAAVQERVNELLK